VKIKSGKLLSAEFNEQSEGKHCENEANMEVN
jgi:hypothetical protein